jgi:hypothetical protein
MTKDENLSLQRSAGPEESDHNGPQQPAEIAHTTEYHPIRGRSSAILGLR